MVALRETLTFPNLVKPDVVAISLVLPVDDGLACLWALAEMSIVRIKLSPLISPFTFIVVLSIEMCGSCSLMRMCAAVAYCSSVELMLSSQNLAGSALRTKLLPKFPHSVCRQPRTMRLRGLISVRPFQHTSSVADALERATTLFRVLGTLLTQFRGDEVFRQIITNFVSAHIARMNSFTSVGGERGRTSPRWPDNISSLSAEEPFSIARKQSIGMSPKYI
jgi:hypothetical protein